jgi:uncharacterized protein YecA (UPF0149 family)
MTGPKRDPDDGVGAVALAWLPARDYERAVMLWPDFAQSERVAGPDGPLPHTQYCRTMEHILAWPPGRNQPCWCGSGPKYKKCCAARTSGVHR